MAAKLPKTKNVIQNFTIIVAIIFVFGITGAGFFAPSFLEGGDGKLTEFQQSTLNNSSILIVVIISGAITAIGLQRRDSQSTQMVDKLLSTLDKIDPQIVKKAQDEL